MPGLLDATRDWFKVYKIPTGKPPNNFAEKGKFFDREFALKTIQHDHHSWLNMIKGGYDAEPTKRAGISLLNTSLDYQAHPKISPDAALTAINEASQEFVREPAFVDELSIDTVYYIDRSKL